MFESSETSKHFESFPPSTPFNPSCAGEWCANRSKFSLNMLRVRNALCSYHFWPQNERTKPAKRPQKPANERKSQKVGQLGLFHALPAQKHALIGHRCSVMLATGNASTEKSNYIDMRSDLVGSNILPNGQQHVRRRPSY